ncbi:hypothetical protein [Pseudanabaena sp. FACHB-2040]|nr:hypothetical protein [Pseudanabaena sp. FACHB-2040]
MTQKADRPTIEALAARIQSASPELTARQARRRAVWLLQQQITE